MFDAPDLPALQEWAEDSAAGRTCTVWVEYGGNGIGRAQVLTSPA